MNALEELSPFLEEITRETGKIIQEYFHKDITVEFKDDHTPVTIADKKVEEYLRHRISHEFPKHGIIGEEFAPQNEDAEYVWVLDPIDGTKSFISKVPLFGTLIALTHNGKPVLGLFHQPLLNLFLIGDNQIAFLNKRRVRARKISSIAQARLLTTDIMNFQKRGMLDKFLKLMGKVELVRTWGDCFGYYLVSVGMGDIMIDPMVNLWDAMAVVPIIQGAGAKITDLAGQKPENPESLVAAIPEIHREVMRMIR